MEYIWLFYSLTGLLFLGLADFTKKVMLKNGGNKDIFLFMCFVFYIIALLINLIFNFDINNINYDLIQPSLIIGFFDIVTPIGMLAALKYLDTSFTFISTRLLSSFFILFIGVYILGDYLSVYNLIGFFLGVISLYLLSGFSFKKEHTIKLKGIIGVLMALTGMIVSHSYFKYVVNDVDIDTFMFFKFLVSFILLVIYMGFRNKFNHFNNIEVKRILIYALISCFLFVSYFLYILPQMYILGTLSLSYKMLSYSLFVPVILSLLIYREEISKKKIFAILLTIISVTLFIF